MDSGRALVRVYNDGTYEHEPIVLAGTSVDLSHEILDQAELEES